MTLHPCPCCGSPTIETPGWYDICPECWWEDDPDTSDLNANRVTLQEAQDNYARYGACDPHGYWCKTGKNLE